MPLKGRGNIRKATDELVLSVNNKLKGVYLSGLGQIVKLTPVDEGRARNNWFLSVSSPSGKVTNKTSSSSSSRELKKMPKIILGKKVYFTNNLPYIGVLEYG